MLALILVTHFFKSVQIYRLFCYSQLSLLIIYLHIECEQSNG